MTSDLCAASGIVKMLTSVLVFIVLCLAEHASCWAGVGVVAVYFQSPWSYPDIVVQYYDTFDYFAPTHPLHEVRMEQFKGPLPQYSSAHYAEIPANSATFRFVNNRTNSSVPPWKSSGASITSDNHAMIQDGMYVVSEPGIYYYDANNFKKQVTVQQYSQGCPGAPPTNVIVPCSSHGSCNLLTQECLCDDDWTNPACEGLTLCSTYPGYIIHGNFLENYPQVFSSQECCTKCFENQQCEAAQYDFDTFGCDLYANNSQLHYDHSQPQKAALLFDPPNTTTAAPITTTNAPAPPNTTDVPSTESPTSSPSSTTTSSPLTTPGPSMTTATPTVSPFGTTPGPSTFAPHPSQTWFGEHWQYIMISLAALLVLVGAMLLIQKCTQSPSGPASSISNDFLAAENGDPALKGPSRIGSPRNTKSPTFRDQKRSKRDLPSPSSSDVQPRSASETPRSVYEGTTDYSGKYRILRVLGRGAFGTVYLVTPTSAFRSTRELTENPQQLFAMKIIHCSTDNEMLIAFNEFKAIKQLQGHPGIAKLADMFMGYETNTLEGTQPAPLSLPQPVRSVQSLDNMQPGDSLNQAANEVLGDAQGNAAAMRYVSLVMEYYPEGTLEDAIVNDYDRIRQPSFVVSTLKQLLSAIAYSHQKQIVHRDLKPGNVLLANERRRVVVTDFGLAKDVGHSTTNVAGGGTLHYLAPEQLEHRCSRKSDVWAIACIIVAMVTQSVGRRVRALFMLRTKPNFEEQLRAELRHGCRMDVEFGQLQAHPEAIGNDSFGMGTSPEPPPLVSCLAAPRGIPGDDLGLRPFGLEGGHPRRPRSAFELESMRETPPRSPSTSPEDSALPEGVVDLLLAMLQPTPIQRPSAEECYRRLLAIVDDTAELVSPLGESLSPSSKGESLRSL